MWPMYRSRDIYHVQPSLQSLKRANKPSTLGSFNSEAPRKGAKLSLVPQVPLLLHLFPAAPGLANCSRALRHEAGHLL